MKIEQRLTQIIKNCAKKNAFTYICVKALKQNLKRKNKFPIQFRFLDDESVSRTAYA